MATKCANNTLIQVTNFDVVVRELPGRGYVLSEEYDGKEQTGNSRFNTLIDVFSESFNTNKSMNNQIECDKIVGNILDSIRGKNAGQSWDLNDDGDVYSNTNQGRFLVKEIAALSDTSESFDSNVIGWEWRELDEISSKQLINQTLLSRIEEREKGMFEPMDVFDTNSFELDGIDTSKSSAEGSRRRNFRRARSTSSIMLDSIHVLGEFLNFQDVDEEDDFEPLPLRTSLKFHDVNHFDPDLDGFEALNDELNNRTKKRERTSSLLRRSNSFESALDKKKIFKVVPETSSRSSRRMPSFIRSHDAPSTFDLGSLRLSALEDFNRSSISEFESIASQDSKNTDIAVPTHEGLDIVLLDDCKTLSKKLTILGNNRLRILLKLESKRFLVLSPAEQKKTASDLVSTITEDWKGRILVEKGSSYNILNYMDGVEVMHSLLLGSKYASDSNIREVDDSKPPTSSKKPLLCAPPLPKFLQAVSKDLLACGKKKCSSEMTAKERQAAAIEALKERNRNKQLAKEKTKYTD